MERRLLGLVNQSMNQDVQAFKYLREKNPRLNDAKVKEGFVGSQTRQLLKDPAFDLVWEGNGKR